MIRQPGLHRWRDSQRLVQPAKIVVEEIKCNGMLHVLDLLAESIRKPGEPTHIHPHS